MTTMVALPRSAKTELGQRLRTLVHGKGRSTTRRTLLALVAGLLITTVIVFGTTLLAFTQVQGTAETVRTHTVPAILQLTVARAALAQADSAAIRSFQVGEVQLAGPGQEFQNYVASANQSLTQVAEDNMAGEAGSGILQLVQGLLVTYTGLIGQADAHYRQSAETTLGAADLWSASNLMHAPQNGILAQLDTLLDAQKKTLDDQLSASSVTLRAVLVTFVPILVLLVLMVVGHIILRRRFRRTVNLGLVLAAALLVALSAVSSLAFVSQHRLEFSRSMLYELVADWAAHTSATKTQGQKTLRDLLLRDACDNSGGCSNTVTRFIGGVGRAPSPQGEVDNSQLTDKNQEVTEQAAAAGAYAGLEPLIYVLSILIATAIVLGFRPRLYEYRYRPR